MRRGVPEKDPIMAESPAVSSPPHANAEAGPDVIVRGTGAEFVQQATAGRHQFAVDEPVSYGGTDTAATPYDLLLAALGSCTSMTIGLYARRKGIPLENVTVSLWHSKVHATDCAECETRVGKIDRIEVAIELTGALNDQQRATLLQVAKLCPVHRTLSSEINIRFKDTAQ